MGRQQRQGRVIGGFWYSLAGELLKPLSRSGVLKVATVRQWADWVTSGWGRGGSVHLPNSCPGPPPASVHQGHTRCDHTRESHQVRGWRFQSWALNSRNNQPIWGRRNAREIRRIRVTEAQGREHSRRQWSRKLWVEKLSTSFGCRQFRGPLCGGRGEAGLRYCGGGKWESQQAVAVGAGITDPAATLGLGGISAGLHRQYVLKSKIAVYFSA